MTSAPVICYESVTIRFPESPHTGHPPEHAVQSHGEGSSASSKQRAIGPLNFTISAGEKVLLLGPSGCGKSTILRAMTGAIPHAIHAEVSGTIEVLGRDMALTTPSACAANMGLVQQDPWASVCLPVVEDDVAFPLENAAVPPAQISSRVAAAAEKANVTDLLTRKAATLSGGQLQRSALATAVVLDPDILILDEPTSMLDSAGIATVTAAIAQTMHADTCAIIVEHRLDEIAEAFGPSPLPSRWIVCGEDGTIVWDGNPATIDTSIARHLVESGCWLPLDTELLGVFGVDGGLDNAEVCSLLATATQPDSARSPATMPGLSPVLVRDLAVTPQPLPRRRSRSSRKQGRNDAGPTPVLEHLNFDLNPGELTALVGENGCGKTTLLRTLAGVHQPLSGTVGAAGNQPNRAGLIFQNPEHQFMANTVRAELAYGLPSEATGVVDQLLDLFGLAEHAEQSPFSLSGGQKRRLSLAAVIAHDYDLILADEPTFGLDKHGAMSVLRSLRDYCSRGKTAVMASHDMRAVATYADRVLVVGQGRLLADVTPWELFTDASLCKAAGLRVPTIVDWCAQRTTDSVELSARLRALDALGMKRSADPRLEPLVGVASGVMGWGGMSSSATSSQDAHSHSRAHGGVALAELSLRETTSDRMTPSGGTQ